MANTDNLDLKRLDGPKTTKFDYDLYVENNFEKVDAAMGAPPSTLTTEAKTLVPAINELKSDKVDKETGKGLSTNDFDNTYKQIIDTDIPAQLAEKANKTQPAWITPTLLNGWTAYDVLRTPRYRLNDLGQLEIIGMVKDGVIGQPIFVLPSGFRPNRTINLSGLSDFAHAGFQVQNNGNVRYERGGNIWLVLDFIIERGV